MSANEWFEIPVLHFEESVEFYTRLFQRRLSIQQLNGTRVALIPSLDYQSYAGALIECPSTFGPVPSTMRYIHSISNLATIFDRIVEGKGTILSPFCLIRQDLGYVATFRDPEGNTIAIHTAAIPQAKLNCNQAIAMPQKTEKDIRYYS